MGEPELLACRKFRFSIVDHPSNLQDESKPYRQSAKVLVIAGIEPAAANNWLAER